MEQHECKCKIDPGKKVGWCPYHKIWKTAHWIKLCQTRPGYRKMWDEGRGPGQITRIHQKKVEEEQNLPPFYKRVYNFAKAATDHIKAGSPKCTEEEIKERLYICRKCEFFHARKDGGVCAHKKCGCNLQNQKKYFNKLAWADQECPIGKWGKIDKNGV